MHPKNVPTDVAEHSNKKSLAFKPNNFPSDASGRKTFLMLLRRVGLTWQVGRIMVLNQDQISKLIRSMKTGIWLVMLIWHWQVRVLR